MAKKSSVAIITDSTCNIPTDLVKKHNIYIVAQHLIWGTDDLLDQIDISPSTFYERLTKDPVHPKTSQPAALEFIKVIEKALKDGATEALVLTVSSPLSGTHASAVQAAADAKVKVTVHDSKSAAMGLGWQVIAAARARDSGADTKSMVEAAEKVRKHMAVILAVDTLEFLHKGGRIGGAAKLIGTALNLKPQLVINRDTGKVESGERTRTRSKAIDACFKAFFKDMDTSKPLHVAVHHAAAQAECDAMIARVKSEHPKAEVVTSELTPVLGTHGGPGTLALCGYYES
jgi:DegV family protein with EDD domain